jgi:hypothetical protein
LPRTVLPAPALVEARDAVSKLIIEWDDGLADTIAAENLFLDWSKERRRKYLDDLRTRVGVCSMPQSFDFVENALRGRWTMSCARGKLQAAITLAPTMPPTVQFIDVQAASAQPQRASTCTSF